MRASLLASAVAVGFAAILNIGPVAAAARETRIPAAAIDEAAQLRETALASDLGYRITRSLTTQVGARMAGSEADAQAG